MNNKNNNPKKNSTKVKNIINQNKRFIGSILLSLVLVFVLVAFFKSRFDYGSKLIFENSELFYTKSISEVEAKSLGDYLTNIGYFNENKISMQLSKPSATYNIGVIVTEDYYIDENLKKNFRNLAIELSDNVFNKEKVNINICNKYFKVQHTISYHESDPRIGQRLVFNEGSLYYTSTVEKDYAEALGKYLIEEEFFDATEQTAQINKTGDSYMLKVIVNDYYEPTAEDIFLTKLFATELSDNIFDSKRLDIALCNQYWEPISIIRYDNNTPRFGLKIRFGYDEIYYNPPIEKTEAIALGKFLLQEGFFKNHGTPVQINKRKAHYELKIIPNENLKIDSNYIDLMKNFALRLSKNVFNENKVYVVICDEYFNEKESFSYDNNNEPT